MMTPAKQAASVVSPSPARNLLATPRTVVDRTVVVLETKQSDTATLIRKAFQSGDAKEVEACLKKLANDCANGLRPDMKTEFILAGGYAMTVLVMEKWPKEAGIHILGVRALANASRLKNMKPIDLGIVEAVLGTMLTFPGDNDVQETALRGLYYVCSDCVKNIQRLVEVNGARVVVETMKRFQNYDCVQIWGCRLLRLAGQVEHLANKVFRAKAIHALMELTSPPFCAGLRKEAKDAVFVILDNITLAEAAP